MIPCRFRHKLLPALIQKEAVQPIFGRLYVAVLLFLNNNSPCESVINIEAWMSEQFKARISWNICIIIAILMKHALNVSINRRKLWSWPASTKYTEIWKVATICNRLEITGCRRQMLHGTTECSGMHLGQLSAVVYKDDGIGGAACNSSATVCPISVSTSTTSGTNHVL